MNEDMIYRRDVLNLFNDVSQYMGNWLIQYIEEGISSIPPAHRHPTADVRTKSNEPNRLENAIHGKSPEEIYEFISWLFLGYAMQFTDSRRAIIDWLKGEEDELVN